MGFNASRVRYKREKRDLALPAFLPGIRGHADWHMREAKPGETPHTINLMGQTGEYVIPMSDSHKDQVIKLHELLHAAHSPVEPPRDINSGSRTIRAEFLLIAEEHRINMYLRHLVGLDLPEWDDDMRGNTVTLLSRFFLTGSPQATIDLLKWLFVAIPLWPYPLDEITDPLFAHIWPEIEDIDDREWSWLRSIFGKIYMKNVALAVETMNETNQIFSWEVVVYLAKALQEFQELMENPDKRDGLPESAKDLPEDLKKVAKQLTGFGPSDEKEPAYKRALRREGIPDHPEIEWRSEGKVVWARMRTRKLRFTEKLPRNKLSRSTYQASEEGAVPRYIHRLTLDGKIFGRKKRSNGGTVLIDDSGSMSWGLQDIQDIVNEAPAATIAAYSGDYHVGELVIIAEKGHYANVNDPKNRPEGGGNYVDLPALEWLSKQQKPRIWVSDAQAFPMSGSYSQAIMDCLEFCHRHDINLVENAQQAHAVFTGEQELYR